MSGSSSRPIPNPISAGLTAESIEKYYDTLAQECKEREDASSSNAEEPVKTNDDDGGEKQDKGSENRNEVGFGAGGIVAGIMLVDNLRKSLADENNIGSVAADIKAGMSNVAAGSVSAVLTSAGNGSAGLAIVMGASACVPVVVAGGVIIWTRWLGKKVDDDGKTD
ncbi:hypothetical protein N0V86_002772 [Didymella sp. IMI 355093]|nr:hypothetical protein N0V86_002772 [Didymella sp. IMI 355093]